MNFYKKTKTQKKTGTPPRIIILQSIPKPLCDELSDLISQRVMISTIQNHITGKPDNFGSYPKLIRYHQRET